MNAYEELARMKKVQRLVEVTPIGTDPKANADVIRMLEEATPEARADYAKRHAGLKSPPSNRTWAAFIAAMRARVTPANDRPAPAEEHPFLRGLR